MSQHQTGADLIRLHIAELSGLLGALVTLSFLERLTIVHALVALAAGVSCAYLGTPIAIYYWQVPDAIHDSVSGLVGLACGLIGFFLVATIARTAQRI